MTLILSGTDGLSDVDGSAATPAIRGTDANTGIFFPAADTMAMATGGTEAMRIDSAGNVGIGTSSLSALLTINSETNTTAYNGSATDGQLTAGATQLIRAAAGANTNVAQLVFQSRASQPFNRIVSSGGTAPFMAFATNNAERMRIDSSGNVGIGTSSPSGANGRVLEVNGGSGQARFVLKNDTTGSTSNDGSQIALVGAQLIIQNREASDITFETNNSERARITNDGNFCFGTTSTTVNPGVSVLPTGRINIGRSNDDAVAEFYRSGTRVGQINVTTTATSYVTSSDYRLKENIAPMTGALATVAALNPCTYTWKADGSAGQGFIAHELAEVVPDCVTGEKDAVETYTDEEGNEQTRPKYQGIDTSFLVATLTAAIQELKAINDAQAQTIQSLTARIEALEGK